MPILYYLKNVMFILDIMNNLRSNIIKTSVKFHGFKLSVLFADPNECPIFLFYLFFLVLLVTKNELLKKKLKDSFFIKRKLAVFE